MNMNNLYVGQQGMETIKEKGIKRVYQIEKYDELKRIQPSIFWYTTNLDIATEIADYLSRDLDKHEEVHISLLKLENEYFNYYETSYSLVYTR